LGRSLRSLFNSIGPLPRYDRVCEFLSVRIAQLRALLLVLGFRRFFRASREVSTHTLPTPCAASSALNSLPRGLWTAFGLTALLRENLRTRTGVYCQEAQNCESGQPDQRDVALDDRQSTSRGFINVHPHAGRLAACKKGLVPSNADRRRRGRVSCLRLLFGA